MKDQKENICDDVKQHEEAGKVSKTHEEHRKTMEVKKAEDDVGLNDHKRIHASQCLKPGDIAQKVLANEDSIEKHRVGKSEASTLVKSKDKNKTVEKQSKKSKVDTKSSKDKSTGKKSERELTPVAKLNEVASKSKPKTKGKSQTKNSQNQTKQQQPKKIEVASNQKNKKARDKAKNLKREKSPSQKGLANQDELKEESAINASSTGKSRLKKSMQTRSQKKREKSQKKSEA